MTHPPSYSHQGVNLGSHSNLTLSLVHATQIPTQVPKDCLIKAQMSWGRRRETREDQRLVGGSRPQGE